MIRISSVSWEQTRIEENLALPLFLVIWLRRKNKTRDGVICQEVNLNRDQQWSIPAGLFDGSPSYVRGRETQEKMGFISFSNIPHSLTQSPLLSIPPSSSKSPVLLLSLFPCLSIPPSVPGKGIMFLPNQPKGQIKMCCTHSLSLSLSNLLRD